MKPKVTKIDYKKFKHGLSLIERGRWPEELRESIDNLLSYLKFVVQTLDTAPFCHVKVGEEARVYPKQWRGIIQLAPSCGALDRWNLLNTLKKHYQSTSSPEQRVYGANYSLQSFDSLASFVLHQSRLDEIDPPYMALYSHRWEYWTGYANAWKDTQTIIMMQAVEDLWTLMNKDAPPQAQLGLDLLSVHETQAITTVQQVAYSR